MLEQTIHNYQLAITFSIATGVLNIASIVGCLYVIRLNRRAIRLWKEAAERLDSARASR